MTGATRRHVLAGAGLVAASGLLFALAGVAIRLSSGGLSSVEVLFWRNVLSLLILTPWIIVRWPDSLRPAHTGLIVMRGVTVVVSLLCYYYAVSVIPLAEAVLLNFSAPIFVPIFGFLLFRFTLNRAVIGAVVIGFVGAALILKPGTAFFQPAALVGLAAGVLGGLAVVAVWRMPTEENASRIAVYFALIGIVITAGPALVEPRLPPVETWPALVMLGVFSTAAHVLLARGCLIAPADRVGTLQYMSVIYAAGLAWLIWDERVDWFMAAGTLLIIAASVIAVRAGSRGRSSGVRQEDSEDTAAGDQVGSAKGEGGSGMNGKTARTSGSSVDSLHRKWSSDQDYRTAYEEMVPEFDLARSIISSRTGAGLTQAELAERMNTTQSVIARLEAGRTYPSIKTLTRVAQATGTRLKISFEPQPNDTR